MATSMIIWIEFYGCKRLICIENRELDFSFNINDRNIGGVSLKHKWFFIINWNGRTKSIRYFTIWHAYICLFETTFIVIILYEFGML